MPLITWKRWEQIIQEIREGHGHVLPHVNGVKARCGGPALCHDCAVDFQTLQQGVNLFVETLGLQAQEKPVNCSVHIHGVGDAGGFRRSQGNIQQALGEAIHRGRAQ